MAGFGGDTLHMARLFDSSRMLTGGYSLEALCKDWLPEGRSVIVAESGRVSASDAPPRVTEPVFD